MIFAAYIWISSLAPGELDFFGHTFKTKTECEDYLKSEVPMYDAFLLALGTGQHVLRAKCFEIGERT